ncbi:flagellar hook assembly protein FlgD [Methylohalobius crimeensis]|uniref:flagellar hook assembly protein FlgD n=1 Tax=Methylohalobius crimeensis TaxID=244365 RepID=UPI0003B59BD2|nr:flagellar hook assembly protein FlgD [Methylohalobius crimeensis]
MNVDRLQELGLIKPKSAQKQTNDLGQEDFLKLMTTQMTHQNPLKPMENTQFLTQMAQFGTVSGIQGLQKSFTDFANAIGSDQTLQAANLVGRQVVVPSKQALLAADGDIQGAVELTKPTTHVTVKILDNRGVPVRTLDLGAQDAGEAAFSWDGLKDDGTVADPGLYRLQAEGTVDGENQALATLINATVESVSTKADGFGLAVEVPGVGNVDFKDIRQIL